MCGSGCPHAAPVERSSFFFSCLQGICMSRESQNLFLSDVRIFWVHVWCATQTRPRFNVPSERRGVTTISNTQTHRCTMPGPGIEPGPFPWNARVLTTRPLRPLTRYGIAYQHSTSSSFSQNDGWKNVETGNDVNSKTKYQCLLILIRWIRLHAY